MKKFLLSCACMLGVMAASASSYTITFKNGTNATNDSGAVLKATANISDVVEDESQDYVSSIGFQGSVYLGRAGMGLKCGTGSSNGYVELTLAEEAQVKPTKVEVLCANWLDSTSGNKAEGSLYFNEKVVDITSFEAKTLNTVTFTFDGTDFEEGTTLESINVGSSSKRVFVKSVTVYYGEETPDDIVFTATPAGAYYSGKVVTLNTTNKTVKSMVVAYMAGNASEGNGEDGMGVNTPVYDFVNGNEYALTLNHNVGTTFTLMGVYAFDQEFENIDEAMGGEPVAIDQLADEEDFFPLYTYTIITPKAVAMPDANVQYAAGDKLTFTCEDAQKIAYSVVDYDTDEVVAEGEVDGATFEYTLGAGLFEITVKGVYGNWEGEASTAVFIAMPPAPAMFMPFTADDTLAAGDILLVTTVAAQDETTEKWTLYAMGGKNNNNYSTVDISSSVIGEDGEVEYLYSPVGVTTITLEDAGDGYWYLHAEEGYLHCTTGNSNNLQTAATLPTSNLDTYLAKIGFNETNGKLEIIFKGGSRNSMRYNSNNGKGLFSCYGSGQEDIALYRKYVIKAPVVDEIDSDSEIEGTFYNAVTVTLTANAPYILYTLDGTKPSIVAQGMDPSTQIYDGEITITETATLTACASDGSLLSDPLVIEFTKIEIPEGAVTYSPVISEAQLKDGAVVMIAAKADDKVYAISHVDNGKSNLDAVEVTAAADGNIYLVGTEHGAAEFYLDAVEGGKWLFRHVQVNDFESCDYETYYLYSSNASSGTLYVKALNDLTVGHATIEFANEGAQTKATESVHPQTTIQFVHEQNGETNTLYMNTTSGTFNVFTNDKTAKNFVKPVLYVLDAEQVPTGVENIANSVVNNDAPVEYFNLQGIRVANPTNGVYVRRQGNTTSKVLVR